jgi:hypothetical protein
MGIWRFTPVGRDRWLREQNLQIALQQPMDKASIELNSLREGF